MRRLFRRVACVVDGPEARLEMPAVEKTGVESRSSCLFKCFGNERKIRIIRLFNC